MSAERRVSILIVEDERIVAMDLQQTLVGMGYDAFAVASTAEDALARASERCPDLVLMDIRIKGERDGVQTAELLRERFDVAVIYLTAHADDVTIDRAKKTIPYGYLLKPVKAAELRSTIEVAIHRRSLDAIRKRQHELNDRSLSHVSHELRTPLSVIQQFTSLLLDGIAGELNDEQRQYLSIAGRNVAQLTAMIDDLLEVTRLETGKLLVKPLRMDLATVVAELVTTFRLVLAAKGLTLNAAVAEQCRSVYADPARIRQLLLNLLQNAVKFTPAGGTISVVAQPHGDDGEEVCISVQDSGCGIEQSDQSRIFDRLYQVGSTSVSPTGLGLGLFICREIADRHNGRIWVESETGRGSTFLFTLPALSPAS